MVQVHPGPPAFACCAGFGSASHCEGKGCRAAARRAEAGVAFTSFGSTSQFTASIVMTYVYILQSIENRERYYVGATSDLRARLQKHNAGEVSHTSKYSPWVIKTYLAFADEKRAFAFEKYLKSASGRAFAKKRL